MKLSTMWDIAGYVVGVGIVLFGLTYFYKYKNLKKEIEVSSERQKEAFKANVDSLKVLTIKVAEKDSINESLYEKYIDLNNNATAEKRAYENALYSLKNKQQPTQTLRLPDLLTKDTCCRKLKEVCEELALKTDRIAELDSTNKEVTALVIIYNDQLESVTQDLKDCVDNNTNLLIKAQNLNLENEAQLAALKQETTNNIKKEKRKGIKNVLITLAGAVGAFFIIK